ncbi:hypothetical protein MA16_Dca003698 [Dendrobium catenatum]|uniref:Uncharacterized protein n=1 Tax=Dendrobium catenatum TaxID=906689 RepID=A0A2I0WFQ4_9ASPA|nr:hypothetical protein MA16_Dca003698 [Dendrobium catenatum]
MLHLKLPVTARACTCPSQYVSRPSCPRLPASIRTCRSPCRRLSSRHRHPEAQMCQVGSNRQPDKSGVFESLKSFVRTYVKSLGEGKARPISRRKRPSSRFIFASTPIELATIIISSQSSNRPPPFSSKP